MFDETRAQAESLTVTSLSAPVSTDTLVGFSQKPEIADALTADPVAAVLDIIANTVGGVHLLAIWHERGQAPTCMTWHGARSARSDLAGEMIAAACRFALDPAGRVNWCMGADGVHGIMVMTFPVAIGGMTLTVLYRSVEELHRSLEVKNAAVRDWPLLAPFFQLWVQHFKSVARADGFASASDQLDVATFHFDDQGRLLFGNAAGQALLAERDGLRLSGRSLGASSLAETIALQSAIDDAIQCGDRFEATEDSVLIAVSRKGRRPLLAATVSVRSDYGFKGGTAAIVHVIDPEHALHERLAPACKLYGLSPVETRLACLLADGADLADAGKQINVREQTSRSYLKQIFAKTGTKRQAELVRLLLKSAIVTISNSPARISRLGAPIWGGREFPHRGGPNQTI